MSSQADFLDWGRIPKNHLERSIKLQNNTRQTHRLLEAGTTAPADYLESALTAFDQFLAHCMENPGGKLILDAVIKMAEDSKKKDEEIEDIGSLPASSTTSSSSSSRSWRR